VKSKGFVIALCSGKESWSCHDNGPMRDGLTALKAATIWGVAAPVCELALLQVDRWECELDRTKSGGLSQIVIQP
jgi:hypothetical protein